MSLCQLGLDFAGDGFPSAALDVSLAGLVNDIVVIKINLKYVSAISQDSKDINVLVKHSTAL